MSLITYFNYLVILYGIVTVISRRHRVRAVLRWHRATISRVHSVDLSRDVFRVLWSDTDDQGRRQSIVAKIRPLCGAGYHHGGTLWGHDLLRYGVDLCRFMIVDTQSATPDVIYLR